MEMRSRRLRDVCGGMPPFLVHPFPDIVLIDPECPRHMADQIADHEAVMLVVDTFGRMDLAHQLAVLLIHDDQWILEQERIVARLSGRSRQQLAHALGLGVHLRSPTLRWRRSSGSAPPISRSRS